MRLHHENNRRKRSTQNYGRCIFEKMLERKQIKTTFTITRRATTQALAVTVVLASKVPTIVRSIVTAHRNAQIAFLVVAAKLNATQNNALAT